MALIADVGLKVCIQDNQLQQAFRLRVVLKQIYMKIYVQSYWMCIYSVIINIQSS